MATKQRRMTEREKRERATVKKQMQAEGILPPDKPRLNRGKFCEEALAEFESMPYEMKGFLLELGARIMVDMPFVKAEERVGAAKAMKIAAAIYRCKVQAKAEGRIATIDEEFECYEPILKA